MLNRSQRGPKKHCFRGSTTLNHEDGLPKTCLPSYHITNNATSVSQRETTNVTVFANSSQLFTVLFIQDQDEGTLKDIFGSSELINTILYR